jgi:D-alanyl-D-alanine carboxypeptidase (penicillin-binding protein 5/6)
VKVTEPKVWKGAADTVALGVSQDLAVTVPRGRYDDLVATTNLQQPLIAPIAAGTELGTVEISLDDKVVATRSLIAMQAVEQGSWWRRLIDTILLLIWG